MNLGGDANAPPAANDDNQLALRNGVICFDGDIEGAGLATVGPTCITLVGGDAHDSALFDTLKIAPPGPDYGLSEVSAWLQHAAHPRSIESAFCNSARSTVLVWQDAEQASASLKARIYSINAALKGSDQPLFRSKTLLERQALHLHLGLSLEQAQKLEQPPWLLAGKSLFPCRLSTGDPGTVALKLYRADPRAHQRSGTLAPYVYLKSPLPLSPLADGISSLSQARFSMWHQMRDACAEEKAKVVVKKGKDWVDHVSGPKGGFAIAQPPAEETRHEPWSADWSIDECTQNLLDQLAFRVEAVCEQRDRAWTTNASLREVIGSDIAIELEASGEASQGHDLPDMSVASACLGLTTPGLELAFPHDAEEHFLAIEKALLPWSQVRKGHRFHWAADYQGPWLENMFADFVWSRVEDARVHGRRLSTVFGPFIPLLLPWTDLWEPEGMHRLPPDLVPTLTRVLRLNVPYVTLVQHDSGLAIACEQDLHALFPNLLVLSAGGYGHIPVPLLKQLEPVRNIKPVRERTHFVSYVGSNKNAPVHLRRDMIRAMTADAEEGGYSARYYKGEDWRSIMADSRVSLCPRGAGRTSYHLAEAVQMGLVPVHLHLDGEDEAWVPYERIWPSIGFTVAHSGFKAFLEALRGERGLLGDQGVARVEALEAAAVGLRASHFEPPGIMRQIEAFLTSARPMPFARPPTPDGAQNNATAPVWRVGAEGSDLVCRPLPAYPTSPSVLVEAQQDGVLRKMYRRGFDSACAGWTPDMEWSEGL